MNNDNNENLENNNVPSNDETAVNPLLNLSTPDDNADTSVPAAPAEPVEPGIDDILNNVDVNPEPQETPAAEPAQDVSQTMPGLDDLNPISQEELAEPAVMPTPEITTVPETEPAPETTPEPDVNTVPGAEFDNGFLPGLNDNMNNNVLNSFDNMGTQSPLDMNSDGVNWDAEQPDLNENQSQGFDQVSMGNNQVADINEVPVVDNQIGDFNQTPTIDEQIPSFNQMPVGDEQVPDFNQQPVGNEQVPDFNQQPVGNEQVPDFNQQPVVNDQVADFNQPQGQYGVNPNAFAGAQYANDYNDGFVQAWMGPELYQKANTKKFNWCAALFGPAYLFYRKMYLTGALAFLITAIVSLICALLNANIGVQFGVTALIEVIYFVGLGIGFYPIYKSYIQKQLEKYKKQVPDNNQLLNIASQKGRTSALALIIYIVVAGLVQSGITGISLYNGITGFAQNAVNEIANQIEVQEITDVYNFDSDYYITYDTKTWYYDEDENMLIKGDYKLGYAATYKEEDLGVDLSTSDGRSSILKQLVDQFTALATQANLQIENTNNSFISQNNCYYTYLDILSDTASSRYYFIILPEDKVLMQFALGVEDTAIAYETHMEAITMLTQIDEDESFLEEDEDLIDDDDDVNNISNAASSGSTTSSKETFNSSFDSYEGTRKESANIKLLIYRVAQHNTQYSDHSGSSTDRAVTMSYNEKKYSAPEISLIEDLLTTSSTYTVKLEYDDEGYVNNIAVTEE